MNTPIIKALSEHAAKNYIKFHTGSRAEVSTGSGMDISAGFWEWEFTELPGLDNLHCPIGAILESEKLAAKAFGADHTLFSVNGATAAILALVLGSCKPGDIIVVDRGCHSSVFNALVLADVKAVLINSTYEDGIPIPQSSEIFFEAAVKFEAKGVLLTRPNYFGIAADISNLAEDLHKAGKFLLVDEAHGAHFGFHPLLPQAALKFGADGVAQSAHKTLGALNQTAYLHLQGNLLCPDKIANALSMVQTTSPSYPLLASLDFARAWLETEGEERYGRLIQGISQFWKTLNAPFKPSMTSSQKDPTRLVIRTEGVNGEEVANNLRELFNIQVEMADTNYIVCIAVPGDEEGLIVLAEALNEIIEAESEPDELFVREFPKTFIESIEPIDIRASLYSKHKDVEIQESVGCIAGEFVTIYPPGVPILCPGERISLEVAAHLYDIIKSKITIIDDGGSND